MLKSSIQNEFDILLVQIEEIRISLVLLFQWIFSKIPMNIFQISNKYFPKKPEALLSWYWLKFPNRK